MMAMNPYYAMSAKGGNGGWSGKGGSGWGGGGSWVMPGKGGGEQQQQQQRDRALHGIIKSYDDGRGFGFINAPEVPRDIYFKGQGESYTAGMSVAFYLNWAPDGKPQARGVVASFGEGDTSMGTIKSYSSNKGYGFISVPTNPGDVYFKKEFLPEHLQEEELTGRTVQFVIHLAHDGKPQVQQMDFMDGSGPTMPAVKGGGKKRPAPSMGGPIPAGAGAPAKRMKMEPMGGASMMGMEYLEPGTEMEGSVKSFNPKNGWGFIKTNQMSTDVYFKGQYPDIQPGTWVRFNLTYTPDGKPQAQGLQF